MIKTWLQDPGPELGLYVALIGLSFGMKRQTRFHTITMLILELRNIGLLESCSKYCCGHLAPSTIYSVE